jgi:mono/diheme cytochrome c family protein
MRAATWGRWALVVHAATALSCGAEGPQAARQAPERASLTTAEVQPARPSSVVRSRCERRFVSGPVGLDASAGSAIALARSERRLVAYVADAEEQAIHRVDVGAKRWLGATALEGRPAQVIALADGRVVTVLADRNRVVVLEPDATGALVPLCQAPTPREPLALAATKAGAIVVAAGYAARATAYDARDFEPIWSRSIPAEPRAVLSTSDTIWISHAVGGALTRLAAGHGVATAVDVRLRREELDVFGNRRPTKGGEFRPSGQGYALVSVTLPDGSGRVASPRVSIDPEGSNSISSGYGGTMFGPPVAHAHVAVVDRQGSTPWRRMADAASRRGRCLLPRGAASAGHRLWVSCLGQATLMELDARAVDPMAAPRRIMPMPSGPTAVAIAARQDVVTVLAEHEHALAIVDLAKGGTTVVPLPRRAGHQLDPRFVRGRQLFHTTDDTRISRDGRACASCHPDGRSDGLTWSTPNGRRQTIMLAGRLAEHAHQRFGWMGQQRTLEDHLAQTMSRLQGRGLPDADSAALAHYLRTMPSPALGAGHDELVARGEVLFHAERTGCGACHPGGGSDDKRYDVGSGNLIETSLSSTPRRCGSSPSRRPTSTMVATPRSAICSAAMTAWVTPATCPRRSSPRSKPT